MEQVIIVGIFLALAVGYVIRTFVNKYKTGKTGASNCGCAGCGENSQCPEIKK